MVINQILNEYLIGRNLLSNSTSEILEVFKESLFIIILSTISNGMFAQSFSIGHTSKSFVDAERNRTIDVEIYYPSATSGDDVAIASGNFPVLVLGHGFLMPWSAYKNFRRL